MYSSILEDPMNRYDKICKVGEGTYSRTPSVIDRVTEKISIVSFCINYVTRLY